MYFLKRHALTGAGALAGGLAGYLYYRYVGCANGSCAITSYPLNSTAYGMLVGALFFNLFKKR